MMPSFKLVSRSGLAIDRPLWSTPFRTRLFSSSQARSPLPRSSAVLGVDSTQPPVEAKPKPFSQLPGPKELPLVGTFFDVVKGDNPIGNFHLSLDELVQKYGRLVRYSMFGQRRVLVTDPEDIATVYRNAGKFPRRDAAVPLDMYFKSKGIKNSLITTDGEEWKRQRMLVNPALMRPATIEAYAPRISETSDDLAELIERGRDKQTGEFQNMDALLLRWALESVGTIVVGQRLGALNRDGSVSDRAKRMIEMAEGYFDAFAALFFGLPFYRLPIVGKLAPTWRRFERSLDGLLTIGREYVEDKLERLARKEDEMNPNLKEGGDFVSYMLSKPNVTVTEIAEHSLQMIAAAADTTANSVLACLYHLSIYPEAQETLRQEIVSVIGNETVVTAAHLSRMPYLRGFIKESFRMWPATVGSMRILDNDIVLAGYHMPANTCFFFPAYTIGRDERNFSDPLKFDPLRWAKAQDSDDDAPAAAPSQKEPAKCPFTGQSAATEPGPSPYAVLPFGFGARMCIGSKIAYLEIEMALIHILRRFRLSYTQDRRPQLKTKMLMGSDIPLVFNYTPLK